ncbi:MAG: ImmA/IrrE family metallo-endopeptidase [Rhodobacteraceae bacterium]|nr:ImmA/IrrE family metallo-endopeptidase [Paracoccaceae bacterium]
MADYSFKADGRISDWERDKLRNFCATLEGDIVSLAREFGLKVLVEDLLPYERGYLQNAPSYGSPSGWVVKLNQQDRAEVQNFTVAHELGHFVLHKAHLAGRDIFDGRINRDSQSATDPFIYLEPSDQIMESEANQFATALLMPANQFRPAFSRLAGDQSALAKLFFVTEKAVKRRVAELALG